MNSIKTHWKRFSLLEKIVLIIALPIFGFVAGVEHVIAKLTVAPTTTSP